MDHRTIDFAYSFVRRPRQFIIKQLKRVTAGFTAMMLLFALAGCSGSGGSPEGQEGPSYTIGGTVSGLSGTLVLQNNGGDDLTVSADGAFTFAASVRYGSTYDVTIYSRSVIQTCVVNAGSGTVPDQNVTNISVTCTAARYVTNGPVKSMALGPDGTTYIGGDFTIVAPPTGGGLPIDTSTGQRAAVFPSIVGRVKAAVSDGSGGWYIGGYFQFVDGLSRTNFAHVLADGTVDPGFPDSNGSVNALAMDRDTLYAGGYFKSIGGQVQHRIAALDTATGLAKDFNGNAEDYVYTLAVSNGMLHVGGSFDEIDAQYLQGYAEFNLQ
jgi:hypothetical protein